MKRLLTALLLAAALSGCMTAKTESRDTAREVSAAPRIETRAVDALPPELCDPTRYTLYRDGETLYAAEQIQEEGKSGHLRLLRWDPVSGECREVHTFSSGSWLLGLEAGEGELLLLTSRAGDIALTILQEGESPRSVPLPETDLLIPRLFAGQVIAGLPDGTAALLTTDGGLSRQLEQSSGARSVWLPADQAFFCLDTDSHWLTYSPEGELLSAEPLPDGAYIRDGPHSTAAGMS